MYSQLFHIIEALFSVMLGEKEINHDGCSERNSLSPCRVFPNRPSGHKIVSAVHDYVFI